MCLLVGVVVLFIHLGIDMKLAVLGMSIADGDIHAAGYTVLQAFEDNELNYLGFVLHKILHWVWSS
jgi:hypothetical protein